MEFNQINLTTRDHVDRRIVYMVLGTIAALLAIFTLLNAVNGIQAYREQRDYRAKIDDLQQQAKALSAENDPAAFDPDSAAALQQRSRQANYLIALDVFPWIPLLDVLEKAVPPQIVLDRFVPASDLKSIHITGVTPSMEPITQFQDALGNDPLFRSVVLENMDLGTGAPSRKPADSGNAIHFKLLCHLDLETLFPKETYGGLWMTLASAADGKPRKR